MGFSLRDVKKWALLRRGSAVASDVGAIPASMTGLQTVIDGGSPAEKAVLSASVSGYLTAPPMLVKSNRATSAFSVSSGNLVVGQNITVIVPGGVKSFPANAAITAPSYTTGTDYVVTCDGSALAIEQYRTGSDVIGGFHYSLAGAINPYSVWDINYRPTANSPRGMTCVNGLFWSDIYITGVDHHINGTSRAGVTIADGSSPPKIPIGFGGNGASTYSGFNWYAACEILASHGKRMPSWREFNLLAYGVTEGTAAGADPVITKADPARKSAAGVEQATGNMWVIGSDPTVFAEGSPGYIATGGRGVIFASSVRVQLYGGNWSGTVSPGSRSAYMSLVLDSSDSTVCIRGVCGHFSM